MLYVLLDVIVWTAYLRDGRDLTFLDPVGTELEALYGGLG